MEFDFKEKMCGYETSFVFTSEKLHELNEAGFIIGGSLALRLHGFNINRSIYEVDLIISEQQYLEKEVIKYFKEDKSGQFPSDHNDSKYCFGGLNGELYDVLVWDGEIKYITKIIDGFEIKLQSPEQIWFKKKEYNFKGYSKHGYDLNVNNIIITQDEIKFFSEMIGVLNKPNKSDALDDLPF